MNMFNKSLKWFDLEEKVMSNYIKIVETHRFGEVPAVNHINRIIVERLNYVEALNTLELGESDQGNDTVLYIYEELLRLLNLQRKETTFRKIHPDDLYAYKNININTKHVTIPINHTPLLINAWKNTYTDSRILNNLSKINEDNVFDWRKYEYNIENIYLYPMNIIVVCGGNHSQLSAKIHGNVETIIKDVYDFSELYQKVLYDGNGYKHIKTGKYITFCNNYDKEILKYSGVIFEMGRYLLNNEFSNPYIPKTLFEVDLDN